MTGYGRSETTCGTAAVIIEIKSFNHRNLEITTRVPGSLGALELLIRKKIAQCLSRGRIELVMRLETDREGTDVSVLKADLPLIRDYFDTLSRVRDELALPDPITLEMVTSIKNGIYASEQEYDDPDIRSSIEKGVDEALAALMEMKEQEGSILYRDFTDRIDRIQQWLDAVTARVPRVVAEYRQRLVERLKTLASEIEIDEARLAQEIVFMAEKSDITEELVRLDSHISQFRDLLDASEPSGRRLDFIFQEMHREINTIGSKSGDLEIARTVIDVKTELAKLREQVQNIE
jgi:uncharacterized protein (TIGR00255 family)